MSIANGIPAPAHLFADDGGRNAFEREAKGRSTIRWLSESVHSHGRNFLEASKHVIRQSHLVTAYGLHRMVDCLMPISIGATHATDVLEILDGSHQARNVFVSVRPDLELVRRNVRDEVFAKCRQAIETLFPSPAKTHVRRERLVAGTRHVVDTGVLHVDRTMGKVMNRIDTNLCSSGVPRISDGALDQSAKQVLRRGIDEPSRQLRTRGIAEEDCSTGLV